MKLFSGLYWMLNRALDVIQQSLHRNEGGYQRKTGNYVHIYFADTHE